MLTFSVIFQGFTGAVEVEAFPWNDAVVVVDNESPGEGFSLQPEQDVLKYGSGIVIVQTSWVSAYTCGFPFSKGACAYLCLLRRYGIIMVLLE